jgi:hypothetical protein
VQINPKNVTIIAANLLGYEKELYTEGAMAFNSNGTGYLRSGTSNQPFYSLSFPSPKGRGFPFKSPTDRSDGFPVLGRA